VIQCICKGNINQVRHCSTVHMVPHLIQIIINHQIIIEKDVKGGRHFANVERPVNSRPYSCQLVKAHSTFANTPFLFEFIHKNRLIQLFFLMIFQYCLEIDLRKMINIFQIGTKRIFLYFNLLLVSLLFFHDNEITQKIEKKSTIKQFNFVITFLLSLPFFGIL
jgi:hypothetical protein